MKLLTKKIIEISHQKGKLSQIIFSDGSTYPLEVLYHRPNFDQHCKIPENLGCEITEQGYIKVDTAQKTNITNVYACGDLTSPMRSVANAVLSGNIAGAAVNSALSTESF